MCLAWVYFFSWILSALYPCNTIIHETTVRGGNRIEVRQSSDEVRKLKPMIKCVEKIARGWFVGKEIVPLMAPNFLDSPGLSEAFFTGLQNEIATFSVAEDFSNLGDYQGASNAIILIRNSTDLSLFNDLRDLCAPRCRYVLCLLNFYKDEKSLLVEADAVVQEMWRTWIVNLVIVASAGGKFLVAGTYSFESNTFKVPKKPEILAECGGLTAKSNNKIFHKLLMNNCRVNITVSDCLPYAKLVEEDGNEIITGIEGSLVEVVATSLGISLNRLSINATPDTNASIYDDLLSILDNPEDSDIVFCGLYWSISNKTEFSVNFDREKVVWLVPSLYALSLEGLVAPLKDSVWFAIIGLLLFTGIMKILLFRKMSFLGILGLIVGIALPKQPKSLSNRIQFVSWVFFGYIITQSYLASLAGQLMNTNYDTIETMEQLLYSGISFGGTSRHRDLFKDDGNPVSLGIYQKYSVLSEDEYDVVLEDVLNGENRSMALVEEAEVSETKGETGSYEPYNLAETLASYPVSLAVWKGLPYLDQINEKVAYAREAGLISYWSEKYANNSPAILKITTSVQLDMLHLSPSFLLLLLGHAFSLVVFIIEIGVFARKYRVDFRHRHEVKNVNKK